MQIYNHLDDVPVSEKSVVLTIGNFDGVHLGHQKVIEEVVSEAKRLNGLAAAYTFSNHPSEVLAPEKDIKLLYSPEQKLEILNALGLNFVIIHPFTYEFSRQNPEKFLQKIKEKMTLVKLVLGYDAKLGRERKGDREKIIACGKDIGFEVEYLDPYLVDEVPVSSSIIRKAITDGDLTTAKKLLGRSDL